MAKADRRSVLFAIVSLAVLMSMPLASARAQDGDEPPDVVGMQVDLGVEAIEEWELEAGTSTLPSIVPAVSDDLDRGRIVVVDQRNAPGIDVIWRVTLTPGVIVPDVRGLRLEVARAPLAALGLEVVTDPGAAPSDAGVVEQSPDPGTPVRLGETVVLAVAQTTTVPPVRGLVEQSALARLEEAGLVVASISTQSEDRVAEGDAIGTVPEAGTDVDLGASIDLVISAGPGFVDAPDVVGRRRNVARRMIEAAGLNVGEEAVQDSDATRNIVLRQDPVGGSSVRPGSEVSLLLSSGPPPTVTVPEVRGLSQGAATDRIARSELEVVESRFEVSDEIERDLAIGTQPAAGTQVAVGSSVELIVSEGNGEGAGPAIIVVVAGIVALLIAAVVVLRILRRDRPTHDSRAAHVPVVEARPHPDLDPTITSHEDGS